MNDEILLRVVNLSKEFYGNRVLDSVNITLKKGEVFGIIGENGAGKSTFMKILSGIYTPSQGEIYLEGKKVEIKDPLTAKKLGITLIPQEFNLVETLTVFENIFLGDEISHKILLNKKEMKKRSKDILKSLNVELDIEQKVEKLSVAQKQMVEIAKAITHESKILIMDEPTTALTEVEIKTLFDLIKELKNKRISVFFISHKLKEVKEICDRVLILRDGKTVSICDVDDLSVQEMAKRMVGRELSQIYPNKEKTPQETILRIIDFNVSDMLKNITFNLKKGEILGFAGLVGAGRTELAETIIGIRKKSSGQMMLNGQYLDINSPLDAIKNKIAYLSEDRQGKGLILYFDIPKNITLASLDNYSNLFINKKKEKYKAQEYVEKFDIKTSRLETLLIYLSGGNQQKTYFSKMLDVEPQILILDEPTRGIDVNAKTQIYKIIRNLADNEISIILISSEMEEIIGMCDRVYVMREGEIMGELSEDQISEENIMYLASGLTRRETAYENK
ncbi:MAG TPA: sugar ABC transporter ATP-binding protein [Defluviitoga tunisiensis]|nr:sugar ABC transporter ATP-binding protein [Defluviitoga tunisiensis]